MTQERRPSGKVLPAPETDLARRICTFVDFAGPANYHLVSEHFGIPIAMAEWHLAALRANGYLRYEPGNKYNYESTQRWNPDDGDGLGRTGPRTPPRRYHDSPLFSDAESVEHILRQPK